MERKWTELLIVLALILAVGLACNQLPMPVQQSTQMREQAPAAAASPAQPAESPIADAADEKLLEKLAALEKKIDDQQKRSQPAPPPVIRGNTRALVDSPGDGFLALRSDPSADLGYRMAQIPDGAEVRVLNCQSRVMRIGGRNGRWCRVRYDGTTGWAFDGWLVY